MPIFCDYPINYALGFQDGATSFMYAIVDLHDRIIFFLLIVLVVVAWMLIAALTNKDHLVYLSHSNLIELVWTITPAGILWAIGLPSLNLLYLMDEVLDAEITVKAIGSQWFWSYEYTDYEASGTGAIAFDSFMVDEASLEMGDQRQLTVDNSLVLPVNTSIRILLSSNDVIHSFAIPSLALKVDCLPGRLNSLGLIINRPGVFYGQCSELCGANHGFMPIALKAVTIPSYINFLEASAEAL